MVLCLFFLLGRTWASPKAVYLLEAEGIINPPMAGYIVRGIERAEEEGAQAVVIQLDTPGGLMDSMRQIVKKELGAEVPVIVYVAPSGSRAASAGVFITMAAHIAAMAPGTNMGAAHPVELGEKKMDETMLEKVVNDTVAYIKTIARQRERNEKWAEEAVRKSSSITAQEALKLKVIDLVAPSLEALLEAIDGRKVKLPGREVVLETKGAEVVRVRMSFRDKLLHTLSNPMIAYILLMLGVYGLFFELSNPGAIFPGVVGGICLILAFFAFQMLPINYAGIALIILGIILLIMEVKVHSYGLLSIGGIISLLLGSLMLIESPAQYLRLSLSLVLPIVVVSAGFFLFALTMVIRAHRQRPKTGKEGLIGMEGKALTDVDPEGSVEVFGEIWRASSEEPIRAGEPVEVVGVEGLKLKVRRKEG